MKQAIFKLIYSIVVILVLAAVRHYVNFEIAVLVGLAYIYSEIAFKNIKS